VSNNSTEDTTVTQEAPDSEKRRNVQVSDETWTGVSLVSAKTGLSKSAVVEKALSEYVDREVSKLFRARS
jgi:predicted transcriptional regulator